MTSAREFIKRKMPQVLRAPLARVRASLAPPPLEDVVLGDYEMIVDTGRHPRLSLIMPSIEAAWAFGGVTTGIDIFLELCRRTGAEARIITEGTADKGVVQRRALPFGINPELLENVGSRRERTKIPVRSSDIFITYNWWGTLNIRSLLDGQVEAFGGSSRPFLYLIQEYEPHFYDFSSTHMLARLAFDQGRPCWGLINSSQLHDFFKSQGHMLDRTFVFEPKISESLRPALAKGQVAKAKRILVYGRPSIPRNCFPAVEKGLRIWAERYPQFSDWEVVSAGLAHSPIPISASRALRSLGKLSLDDYAELLRTSAVGLSLMASPHPSYPPLEMAHFGLITITNQYRPKDLSTAHDNFISIADIDAPTVAAALAKACERFEDRPDAGWQGQSHMPAYLDPAPWPFFSEIAVDLKGIWDRYA